MKRAHRIRLNPTPEQREYFMRASGVARFAWNWALTEYNLTKSRGKKANWNAIMKAFRSQIDDEFPWVREVTKCAPEQAIADLRQSINTYYKVKKANPKRNIRFPGYRKRSKKIGGFGLNNDQFSVADHMVHVPRLGEVNMAEALRLDGKILSGRVKERAGRWYVTVLVEIESQPATSPCGSVGVDFGLSRLATLSNGEVSENQTYFCRSERKLKMLQRGLARKTKGSTSRAKWTLRVGRLQEQISNQRSDYLHKFTTSIARRFGVVCVEDLNLKGLTQTRLAKSFNDAGIGEAVRQLGYKASWLQKVDRFFASSKLCSNCGAKNDLLKLSDREWDCLKCGTRHDRDLNASLNIELEGIRLLAGSGYVGATPVELATSGRRFAVV